MVADRKGDIFALQVKHKEAALEYKKAFKGLDDRVEYKRLVEVKLNALGIDPVSTLDAQPTSADIKAPDANNKQTADQEGAKK
jgi:hypothetical protein